MPLWFLTPSEFADLAALEHDLLALQSRYQTTRRVPLDVYRAKLHHRLARLAASAEAARPAA